jgi:tRNA nucleotidyltransferase/poly(A) polymerase
MEAMGFSQVGASFPVFLDKDGNEHALARQEKKVSEGYNGFEVEFAPTVTIEQDLERRDLTMNSMAVPIEYWSSFVNSKNNLFLVDPFYGQRDIINGILRHTSDAFAEDPIRILRAARLSARYGFDVHSSTVELMKKVVPELDTVPQERIWAEFQKGLMEEFPAKMFEVLRDCDALRFDGPLAPYCSVNIEALKRVMDLDDICVRFALISHNFDGRDFDTCRIPTDCAKIGSAFHLNVGSLPVYLHLSTTARLHLLERLKAFSDDWIVRRVMRAWECLGHKNYEDVEFNLARDIVAARKVDCAAVAESCNSGREIKQAIFDARVRAMEEI